MRLSDMLKRKRNASRKSSRKTSGAGASREDLRASGSSSTTPNTSLGAAATSTPAAAAAVASGSKSAGATPKASSSTAAGRRSRLSSASSLFSSLNPVKWGRSNSQLESTPTTIVTPSHQQTREKIKVWVRNEAQRLLEANFKESLGSRHPALTILRRLSAQVDHLTKKPQNGERCLKEIQSILVENDISPFEVCQSGLVASLLTYISRPDQDLTHPTHATTPPPRDRIMMWEG